MRQSLARSLGLLVATFLFVSFTPLVASADEGLSEASEPITPLVASTDEGPGEASEPITIADAQLLKCVQEQMESLQLQDADQLTELSCEYKEDGNWLIVDFSGLEKFTKLEKLSLTNFSVAQPDPDEATKEELEAVQFPSFEKLQELTFNKSFQLPKQLAKLPELKVLNLTEGQWSDFPELIELLKLELVDLTKSNIDEASINLPSDIEIRGLVVSEPASVENPDSEVEVVSEQEQPVTESVPSAVEPMQSAAEPVPSAVTNSEESRRGTPAPDDEMPDGPLKSCINAGWNKPKTYANVSTKTYLTLSPRCVGGTVMSDWKGIEFLPSITNLTINSMTDGIVLPPDGLVAFGKLNKLAITSSELTQIPKLGELKTLQTLDLKGNQLTTVPDNLTLPALKTLVLSGNKISHLNIANSPNLPSLTSVEANKNEISTINLAANTVTNLTVQENKVSSLTAITAPHLIKLDIRSNQLSDLAGISALSSLKTLNASANHISDISAASLAAAEPKLSLSSQEVGYKDIPTTQPQDLASVLKVPAADQDSIVWTGSENNMAAINPASGKFTAIHAGSWKLTWKLDSAFGHSYSGTVSGEATGADEITIELVVPKPANENETATLAAQVQGLDGASFEWFISQSESGYKAKQIEGVNEANYQIDSVSLEQAGKYFQVVAVTDAGRFASKFVELTVKPILRDPQFEKCVIGVLGTNNYTTKTLSSIEKIDCSNQNITSLEDLRFLSPRPKLLNFVDNQITDVTPLLNDRGDLRTGYGGLTDLSNNLISDISPIGVDTVNLKWADLYHDRWTTGLILDGNRINDLSPIANMQLPKEVEAGQHQPIAVRAQNQRLGLPAMQVDTANALPTVTGLTDSLPLVASNGTITGRTVTFNELGEQSLSWELKDGIGVQFSGAYQVKVVKDPAAVKPLVEVLTDNPVAGHPVTILASAFTPNSKISFTVNDQIIAKDLLADGSGSIKFSYRPDYGSGAQLVTATDTDGLTANITYQLTNDTVVDIPDQALRGCIIEKLGLADDAITYQSRLAGIAGNFDCQGKGISDLIGIEYIGSGLINVSSNQIVDFSPLANLENVTVQALNQSVSMTVLAGKPYPMLNVVGFDPGEVIIEYPQEVDPDDETGTVIWPKAGTYQVPFRFITEKTPKVTGSGSFIVHALDGVNTQVRISPSEVYPGQLINAVAIGFDPNEEVTFQLKPSDAVLGTVTANALGVASLSNIEIDFAMKPGAYVVHVSGSASQAVASTALVINQPETILRIAPEKIYPGQMINILAGGFVPGEQVSFQMHSDITVLGSAKADEKGIARLNNVVIPKSASVGKHRILAIGEKSAFEADTGLELVAVPADKVITVPGESGNQPPTVLPLPQQGGHPILGATIDQSGTSAAQAAWLAQTGGLKGSGGQPPKTGVGNDILPVLFVSLAGLASLVVSRNRNRIK